MSIVPEGRGPKEVYKDLDLDFTRNPISGDVSKKIDVEAVKRSLRNLILYRKNEKFFQPNFSADVQSLLFEHNSPVYLSLMRTSLEDAIKSFEPRINNVKVNFTENYESNDLYVKIYFSVASFPLNLEEMNVVLERVR